MIATVTKESIEKAVENAYPFSVDKFRLSGPDNMITDLYGCFRSDNHDCIGGAVKKNYNPHCVEDIKALAVAAMEGFDGADLRCLWNDGHILVIEPTKEYRRSIFGTTDNIFPRAFVEAKYGGLSSLNGSLGLYRDVCQNLMLARSAGRVVKMNIRHSNNLGNHLKELIDQFRNLLNNWNGVADEIVKMNSKEIDFVSFIREVYPLPEKPTETIQAKYDRRIREIIQRVQNERKSFGRIITDLSKATAWEAYNAVQGYEQHVRGRHNNPSYYDRALLALDSKEERKAYSLALEMAG